MVRDRCLSSYVPCIYPHIYLIIVLWEAVIVGRDGRDKVGTGVSKHVLKDLLLSLLQSSHLVLKPLLQLRVDSFIYMLTIEKKNNLV